MLEFKKIDILYNKMNIVKPVHIALDLDEVISPMLPHLVTYYINKYHKGNMNYKQYYMHRSKECGYKYASIFSISNTHAKHLVHDFYSSIEAKTIKPYNTSIKAIYNLKKKNAKISIITGRQKYQNCKDLTYAFVGRYFGSSIDNIYFTNSYSLEGEAVNKLDICKTIDADILVDDCVTNFENNETKILTIQYVHNPYHKWSSLEYENSIEDLNDIQKYIY